MAFETATSLNQSLQFLNQNKSSIGKHKEMSTNEQQMSSSRWNGIYFEIAK